MVEPIQMAQGWLVAPALHMEGLTGPGLGRVTDPARQRYHDPASGPATYAWSDPQLARHAHANSLQRALGSFPSRRRERLWEVELPTEPFANLVDPAAGWSTATDRPAWISSFRHRFAGAVVPHDLTPPPPVAGSLLVVFLAHDYDHLTVHDRGGP
ncbi:hypothetical protein DVS28_b0006 (plasmid) [Euzebya pacifica]|uniref:Uncharacterized protein n=1 Tax=Euzebya pacifica TaxID=1608957 RepID=A0A346Y5M9_9ACTN|nr:hypothetical protein [Euzebya pacifica]AXV09776.1 hypothetical protein DVS28_b0006 [Euzebya pacifica]